MHWLVRTWQVCAQLTGTWHHLTPSGYSVRTQRLSMEVDHGNELRCAITLYETPLAYRVPWYRHWSIGSLRGVSTQITLEAPNFGSCALVTLRPTNRRSWTGGVRAPGTSVAATQYGKDVNCLKHDVASVSGGELKILKYNWFQKESLHYINLGFV